MSTPITITSDAHLARAIVELAKSRTDHRIAEEAHVDDQYPMTPHRREALALFTLEVILDAAAAYLLEALPHITRGQALSATLLTAITPYMPASKYNGLFFYGTDGDTDDTPLPVDLDTWSNQFAIMLQDRSEYHLDQPLGEITEAQWNRGSGLQISVAPRN